MARPLIFTAGGMLAATLFLALALPQRPASEPPDDDKTGARLKRSQMEEILKADRAKSIEDAGQLVKLSVELQTELEKNSKNVLSVTALRKAEEIEKIAKRIRGRLRRF
jgi:hypothetical protein